MRLSSSQQDPSVAEIAARLESDYPGVPLVALGQTVLWDEPTKAALFATLEDLQPGGRQVRLGVNDHDYFSKTSAALPTDEPFAILEHNDGTTRDLWVATGELSMLWGSETIVTRDLLREHGVELEVVSRGGAESRDAFLDRATAAWGWRGIVETGDRRQIAHEIRLADILPSLVELIRWGFCESAALLADADARQAAAAFADEMIGWFRNYDRQHPGALLSDAYRDAHLFFFRRLTGRAPAGIETFTSTDAFRFGPETVDLPRFRILGVFLEPATRDLARQAYNAALEGSQTYGLDRFGPGAIPFDLVIPGRGRGTLRILPDGVAVATPDPVWLPTETPVESAAQLADVLARQLGPGVALVGKGHVFVCMITSEAILVFHEGGSSYVRRTARLLRMLADAGVSLPLYPILRVRHHTWDALADTDVEFHLPQHLAQAFGAVQVSGPEFARRWREVVAEQERLLREVAGLAGIRHLVEFLAGRTDGVWRERLKEYAAAHDLLIEIRDRSGAFEERSRHLYEELARVKSEAQRLEAEKGENYRRTIKPLRERLWELAQQGTTAGPEVERIEAEIAAQEAPRAEFDRAIRERREQARELEAEAKAVRKARMENEKSGAAARARAAITAIEREAESARLKMVRAALLVTRGLPQSNLRPSAWWFPLVDPSGRWFEALARRMELYFEHLGPEGAS